MTPDNGHIAATGKISPVDEYYLDVAGFVVLPGVLSASEVASCLAAIDRVGRREGMLKWEAPHCDPFMALAEHPTLKAYLDALCYQSYRLDDAPCLLADELLGLDGGNEPRNWSRSYHQLNGTRFILGFHAVWALEDIEEGDGGFSLVPCSHKSLVETPADVVDGSDDMGLTVQPALKAGDLLLCVETLLKGMRPWTGKTKRLISARYISNLVRQSNNNPSGELERTIPDWVDDLTEEERIIIGADRPNPAAIVHSDGVRTWVDESPGTYHPSILKRDPDCGIDEKEFYFWDLNGYLVVRGVMDEEWLMAANAAVDASSDEIVTSDGDATHGSKRLAGNSLSSLSGILHLPHPHCEPFRRMIANPALVQRMNWMSGSGFVVDAARVIVYEKSTSGHGLHSGPIPGTPRSIYSLQNGRTHSETLNVAWQLRDTNPGDGGYCCLPGTHKSSYPMPDEIRHMDDDRLIRHVPMQAGDLVIFMGSGQIHGALPWMNDTPRRAVIFNYVSRSLDQPARARFVA